MDLKDIKAIIDLMKKNAISDFEMEKQDFKIRLRRAGAVSSQISQTDETGLIAYTVAGAQSNVALIPASLPAVSQASNEIEIKSPMVGTFYRAPSPEAGNYIEIGSEVSVDSVICLIEAMKVMNEIKSELKGVITQVLVENAKPVEFGQPLFKIRPL
ncbi:MAG: acetyl-CoA carboxylase biotin carboxyl carrier protein [Pedosphaera sp.]|nr:acetyl-CoA carboxylase biotin carboxyl carrier protein [Pedosphaera sp.]